MGSLATENMPAKSGGSQVHRPHVVERDEDGEEIRQMGASGNFLESLELRVPVMSRILCLLESRTLEIPTGFPPGFFLVSKTCHDALSTINRDKVSVSVFFTFDTV